MARRKEKPPVERVGEDAYALHIGRDERDVLVRMLDELRTLLVGDADEQALRRIFPPAYHLAADADADAEYQRLMREEVVASRLSGIGVVEGALRGDGLLDESQVTALMQAINGLRLVLGTILDVDEHIDLDELDVDHPQLAEHHLYEFLSWLLDWTVRAVSARR